MATDAEIAWVAGLFEGEGCITFTGVNSVSLLLKMTDLDCIQRLHAILGRGQIQGVVNRPDRKALYSWATTNKTDALAVLDLIEPWLLSRRAEKAAQARARLEGCRDGGFCKRGHEIVGANRYESPGGQVQCRACNTARSAARPARSRIKT